MRIFSLMAVGLLSGCGVGKAPEASQVKTVSFQERPFDSTDVNVCWDVVTSETTSFRQDVERIISESFEASSLRFYGWQACSESDRIQIRMFIYDDEQGKSSDEYKQVLSDMKLADPFEGTPYGHPRLYASSALQKISQQRVVFNETFEDAEPGAQRIYATFSDAGKANLALSVSLHEFGHALGLAHEDAHPDATCKTFAEFLGSGSVITGYNPFSFMSRCYYRSYNYELGILRPNELDLEGLDALFAR